MDCSVLPLKRSAMDREGENGCGPSSQSRKGWSVNASENSKRALNQVRLSEEKYFRQVLKDRDTSKDLIKLSIGDPSIFGNLPPPPIAAQSLKEAAASGKYCGYGHSLGLYHVREAVAKKFSVVNKAPFTPEDVVMTHSCSGALELAIDVLSNEGQNILLPKPGFDLYRCLSGAKGLEMRHYNLKPECNWEADINELESLVDGNTAALLINNPSNPCGSVYSLEHINELVQFAARHYLPIISDEIYAEMIFSGHTFYSVASVDVPVPALICGGISKQYMLPGWRMGWMLIHDPIGALNDVREGISRLVMKTLGPSTVVQATVPDLLTKVPQEYHQRNRQFFQMNAELVYKGLRDVPGLNPVMPAGSMYLMVGIAIDQFPDFKNDIDFTKQLVLEQSVFCLPGDVFRCPNFFRVVLIMSPDKISEAVQRIAQFCSDHHLKKLSS